MAPQDNSVTDPDDYSSFLGAATPSAGQSAPAAPAAQDPDDYSSFLGGAPVASTGAAPAPTEHAKIVPGFSDRSVEELARDTEFDPVKFYKEHSDSGAGGAMEPAAMDKLAEVARFRQINKVGGKGAWNFFKDVVSHPIDSIKAGSDAVDSLVTGVAKGAYHAVNAPVSNLAASIAENVLDKPERAERLRKEAAQSQVLAAAALEKGSFAADNLVRKAGNTIAESVSPNLSVSEQREKIQREASYQEEDERISRGEGSSTAVLLGNDKSKPLTSEELKALGIHIDPKDVEEIGGVTNPLNLIPLGAGAGTGARFGVKAAEEGGLAIGMKSVSKGGVETFTKLATIPKAAAAGEAIVQGAGKVLKGAGAAAEYLPDKAASKVNAVLTATTPKAASIPLVATAASHAIPAAATAGALGALKGAGKVASALGERLTGETPWGAISKGAGNLVKAGAAGVAGDPLALGNTAVNLLAADNGTEGAKAIGGAAGLGVAGHVASSIAGKTKDISNLTKGTASPENIVVPEGYTGPEAHDVGLETPDVQKANWDVALKGTPEQRRMAYLADSLTKKISSVENPVYVVPVRGTEMPAKIAELGGSATDAAGVFAGERKVGDKTAKVILLNVDSPTNAAGHEFGELLQTVLPAKEMQAVNAAADKAFNGEERDFYGKTYFEATGQGKYDPANPDHVAQARREYLSEVGGAILNGTPVESLGVPPSLGRRLRYAYGSFLQNIAGVKDAAGHTQGNLPVRVDANVAHLVDNVLQSQISRLGKESKTTGAAKPLPFDPLAPEHQPKGPETGGGRTDSATPEGTPDVNDPFSGFTRSHANDLAFDPLAPEHQPEGPATGGGRTDSATPEGVPNANDPFSGFNDQRSAEYAGLPTDFSERLSKSPGVGAAEQAYDKLNAIDPARAPEIAPAQDAFRQSLVDAAVRNAASGKTHLDVIQSEIDAGLPTITDRAGVAELIEHAADFADKHASRSAAESARTQTMDTRISDALNTAQEALNTAKQARDPRSTAAQESVSANVTSAKSFDTAVDSLTEAVRHHMEKVGIDLTDEGVKVIRENAKNSLRGVLSKGSVPEAVATAFSEITGGAEGFKKPAGRTDSPRIPEVLEAEAPKAPVEAVPEAPAPTPITSREGDPFSTPAEPFERREPAVPTPKPRSEISGEGDPFAAPAEPTPREIPAPAPAPKLPPLADVPVVSKKPIGKLDAETGVGVDLADSYLQKNPGAKAVKNFRDALAAGGGRSFDIEYNASNAPEGTVNKAERNAEHNVRRGAEKEDGPGAGRSAKAKTITPERFVIEKTRFGDELAVQGKSLDKVQENFVQLQDLIPELEKMAAGKSVTAQPARKALEILNKASFIQDGGATFSERALEYGDMHAQGLSGTGKKVAVPGPGYNIAEGGKEAPGKGLSQADSDVLNVLMGEPPASTARGSALATNAKQVALAEANPGLRPDKYVPQPAAISKNENIKEVQPLRQYLAEALGGSTGKHPLRDIFKEVSETVLVRELQSAEPSVRGDFTPKGDLYRAGFMPNPTPATKKSLADFNLRVKGDRKNPLPLYHPQDKEEK